MASSRLCHVAPSGQVYPIGEGRTRTVHESRFRACRRGQTSGVFLSVLRRAVQGFAAGLVATAVMTATRIAASEAGVMRKRPPHSEVVGRLRAVAGHWPWGRKAERTATIAHYAFGGGAGAIYAVVAPRRARPVGGAVYSGVIWVTSFLGVFPRVGLMPRPSRDDRGRQIVTAVDHVVYGLALDGSLELIERVSDAALRRPPVADVEPA